MNIELFLHELLNVSLISTFLAEELVAREGKNLQSLISVFFVDLNQFDVVGARQSSLTSHIDNNKAFNLSLELSKVHHVSVDVLLLEAKEVILLSFWQLFSPRLEDDLLNNTTHK